ncbi:unnamed protein product [Calypogeia fissa]
MEEASATSSQLLVSTISVTLLLMHRAYRYGPHPIPEATNTTVGLEAFVNTTLLACEGGTGTSPLDGMLAGDEVSGN